MCGRLDQNDLTDLLNDFSWAESLMHRSEAEPRFNVAPGTFRPILHAYEGAVVLEDRFWGYLPDRDIGKRRPVQNARLEKVTGPYWRALMKSGRAIVPANGWCEWTGEEPVKQPWHIHRADGSLLYMAVIVSWAMPTDNKANTGFVIVTADAVGGMVDVHDRRPIVFTAADAATWLDPAISTEQAEQLARSVSLGPELFDWFPVDRAVGNVRNQGAALAQRIELA